MQVGADLVSALSRTGVPPVFLKNDKFCARHQICHKCKVLCRAPNFEKYFSVKEGFLSLFVE